MSETEQKGICFVIGPIGDSDSDIRVHADWLLEEIIEPVVADFKRYKVVRADKISQPGMIDSQIINSVMDAELVIADLTFRNANAFYELGIRHMAQKPTIHLILEGDDIPFDVSLYRATKFARARPRDIRASRDKLRESVKAVLSEGYELDNPVTRARGKLELQKSATPRDKVIMELMGSFDQRLSKLESGRSPESRHVIEVSDILGPQTFLIRKENKKVSSKAVVGEIENILNSENIEGTNYEIDDEVGDIFVHVDDGFIIDPGTVNRMSSVSGVKLLRVLDVKR